MSLKRLRRKTRRRFEPAGRIRPGRGIRYSSTSFPAIHLIHLRPKTCSTVHPSSAKQLTRRHLPARARRDATTPRTINTHVPWPSASPLCRLDIRGFAPPTVPLPRKSPPTLKSLHLPKGSRIWRTTPTCRTRRNCSSGFGGRRLARVHPDRGARDAKAVTRWHADPAPAIGLHPAATVRTRQFRVHPDLAPRDGESGGGIPRAIARCLIDRANGRFHAARPPLLPPDSR